MIGVLSSIPQNTHLVLVESMSDVVILKVALRNPH